MYGEVVMGMKPEAKEDPDHFEDILEKKKHAAGVKFDKDLSAEQLKELVAEFKAVIRKVKGQDFPTDPMDQIWGAIGAVFGSWMNDRALVYRRQYGIPHSWGTATNVQAMVFGNLGDDCATGVGPDPRLLAGRTRLLRGLSDQCPRAKTWSPASAPRSGSKRPSKM